MKISGDVRVNSQLGNSRYGGIFSSQTVASLENVPRVDRPDSFPKGYAPSWTDKFELMEGEKNDVVIILKSVCRRRFELLMKGTIQLQTQHWRCIPRSTVKRVEPTSEGKTDESGRLQLEHVAETRYDFRIKASNFRYFGPQLRISRIKKKLFIA